ncbi:MAG: lycopene cyclase family protein [Acidobacteriota bacterium]
MSVERADLVILGAGLSGASLALRLTDPAFEALRIVVVEPRAEPAAERTWCWWRLRDESTIDDVLGPPRHAWSAIEFVGPGGGRLRRTPSAPYVCLPGTEFYARVSPRLTACDHVELRRGVAARQVTESADAVRVTLQGARGTTVLEAPLVFDARPPAAAPADPQPRLVQSFLGWDVETEDAVFDPSCATLMDFAAVDGVAEDGVAEGGFADRARHAARAAHFLYVLPFGPRRALVESTWFGRRAVHGDVDAEILRRWLNARAGDRWRLLRSEHGVLPMDARLAPPPGARRVVPLGIRGGALRPSSGYGFARVQQASDLLAHQLRTRLAADRPLAPLTAPRLDGLGDRWMDRVFLARLGRRPETAPELFEHLFAACPIDRLVRFLAGTARAADRLAVIRALPAAPLAREAVREVLRAA